MSSKITSSLVVIIAICACIFAITNDNINARKSKAQFAELAKIVEAQSAELAKVSLEAQTLEAPDSKLLAVDDKTVEQVVKESQGSRFEDVEQVKLFTCYTDRPQEAEKEINSWLMENRNQIVLVSITVSDLKQAPGVTEQVMFCVRYRMCISVPSLKLPPGDNR